MLKPLRPLAWALLLAGCGTDASQDLSNHLWLDGGNDSGAAVRDLGPKADAGSGANDASADGGGSADADGSGPSPPMSLQFASGFEPNFYLGDYYSTGSVWGLHFGGTDQSTGYTWPDDIPSAQKTPNWQFVVGSSSVVGDYVDVRVQDMIGHRGSTTKALLLKVKDDDPDFASWSRAELITYPNDDTNAQQFVRYWMKLQPDFMDQYEKSDDVGEYWRAIFEVKEPARTGVLGGAENYKYRWIVFINKDPSTGQPCWEIKAMQGNPVKSDHFSIKNCDKDVPLDRWFMVEIYWRQHVTDGRFMLRVDGEVVADHSGRLTHATEPYGIYIDSFLKLYVGKSWFADGGDAYHWIDDLEVHDSIPVERY